MPTPHNEAQKGDFAETVLMPGDPLRAKYVAENFLTDARLVNNVRNVQGYTGLWKGIPVSVMASGMGMPAVGIYAYELFHEYDVKNIIRIGSAGGLSEAVKVRDVVLGMGACTDSNFGSQYRLPGTFAPIADWTLLNAAVQAAEARKIPYQVGNLLSTDVFYSEFGDAENAAWRKMGVLAVEMEAAALYMTAARCGKRALSICTVSDHLLTGESLSSLERQTTFREMIEAALDTAVILRDKVDFVG